MDKLKVGAALMVADLPQFCDWLIEAQRDLEIQDFFDPRNLGDAVAERVKQAQELLDGYEGRLGIHGPFFDLPLDARDPEIRAVCQKRYQQGLDAAAALGATQMVLHSPYSTWDFNNLMNYPTGHADVITRVHETMGPIVERAEALGIELVIENIQDIDPFDRIRLADSFNSVAVQISIDTGHAHYAHGSTGAPPVDYYVRAAKEKLGHVHIQDADGHADRHWAPGEGTINWHAVFRALREDAPQARLVLELRNKDDVPKGFAHLVELGLAE